MFKKYIKVAFRNMLKQKTYSFINIFGLAIGMAISILIFLWVLDEISFDKFHENYEDIQLVYEKQYYSDQEVFSVTATPYPLAPAFKEEYPEVIRSTRFDSYTGQNTNNQSEAKVQIENVINRTVAGVPPTITYLERYLDNRFENEKRAQTLAEFFALLTIIIASLGLVGLSSFIAEQKTKEIGIRKVLGATVHGITTLITKKYLYMVLIVNIIAWPLAYNIAESWLSNYAFRIDMNLSPFLLAAISAILIAVLSVGYKAVKAASINPANSLKHE